MRKSVKKHEKTAKRPKTLLSHLKQDREELIGVTNEEEAFNSFHWYRDLTKQSDGDKEKF